MIKKKIYGNTLKEQFKASANDRLYRFVMCDGTVRGVILFGTRMINEMRANHDLGILETYVLGHAYLTGGLVSANLKGSDRIVIQTECSGPIKGFSVESNAYNEVRGYLKNVPIPVDSPLENFDLTDFFGSGILSLTKYIENKKNPFTGTVVIKYGNIAQDMANYFLMSEQIPTSFNLSIQFDKKGNVTGAGGMFLQAMPGADIEIVSSLENLVNNFTSIGSAFSLGKDPVDLINESFADYSPKFLDNTRVEFMCHCTKERMLSYIAALPTEELIDIIQNGPFPLEIKCHNCNSYYYFERNEIESIMKKQ
jgi:molecular chaperone Hsp33